MIVSVDRTGAAECAANLDLPQGSCGELRRAGWPLFPDGAFNFSRENLVVFGQPGKKFSFFVVRRAPADRFTLSRLGAKFVQMYLHVLHAEDQSMSTR